MKKDYNIWIDKYDKEVEICKMSEKYIINCINTITRSYFPKLRTSGDVFDKNWTLLHGRKYINKFTKELERRNGVSKETKKNKKKDTLNPKHDWIPCSDRIPSKEECEKYGNLFEVTIVVNKKYMITDYCLLHTDYKTWHIREKDKVIAWRVKNMPYL